MECMIIFIIFPLSIFVIDVINLGQVLRCLVAAQVEF